MQNSRCHTKSVLEFLYTSYPHNATALKGTANNAEWPVCCVRVLVHRVRGVERSALYARITMQGGLSDEVEVLRHETSHRMSSIRYVAI